jgi:Pro-kumamolisin, activation domain
MRDQIRFIVVALMCAIGVRGIAQVAVPGVSNGTSIILPALPQGSQTKSAEAPPSQQTEFKPTTESGHKFTASASIAKGPVSRVVDSGEAKVIRPLAATQPIRFTIALMPPRRAELEKLVEEITDPRSPQYRHFLTFDEWKAKYAPSDANVAAVEAWAKGAGFTEVHRFGTNHALVFDGTTATVQKAFSVTMNQYSLAGQTFYANDRRPSVPMSVAPLIDNVLGLSSFDQVKPMLRSEKLVVDTALPHVGKGEYMTEQTVHADAQRPAAKESVQPKLTSNGLEPTDIWSAKAYNYNGLAQYSHCCNPSHVQGPSGGSPVATSIAVLGDGGELNQADVILFLKTYPQLAEEVTFKTFDSPSCCSEELTLDTEWTLATSNSLGSWADTAHIYVYEEGGGKTSDLLNAFESVFSDNLVRVVTTSFGVSEDSYGGWPNTSISSYRDVTVAMIANGWTLAAAAGDTGAYANCSSLSVDYPASDPNITAVGGSTLAYNLSSEGTWTGQGCTAHNNSGGGGGGCSIQTFSAPTWQGTGRGCGNTRAVPDVALNAGSNQVIAYNGGLTGVGGTSIASPMMAGFFAQENSYLAYIGQQGNICGAQHNQACVTMGFSNPALYAATSLPHSPFYDIADNQCNGGGPGVGFCSVPGYDRATGWGSADMLQLAWAINHYLNSAGATLPTISISGPPVNAWYTTDQVVSFTIGGATMGVAGYSAQWDVDPGAVPTPVPGRGSPFWDGPQNPLATSGTLHLNAVGQGCHTAYVRAWDNDGEETAATTYGPLCTGQVNQCQITYSCPAPVHAPPNYSLACPTLSDFYMSWPDQSRTFLSSGVLQTGTTNSYEEGVLACVPGTTSCVGFSLYKPVSEWCAPAPPPPPPPPPGACCKACRAAGGDCTPHPDGSCLCS